MRAPAFPADWRTRSRRKRRFYATYMRTLERVGYLVVLGVIGAFIYAFNYRVDDLVTADKVPIMPNAVPLEATEPTLVVRTLQEDFATVRKGQPLMEIVRGGPAIARYLAGQGNVNKETVAAPADGTFRFDAATIGKWQDEKAVLARVVDYDDLRLQASLAGQTVSKAAVGQTARITSITVDPADGTLFRGNGDQALLSGQLLGSNLKERIGKSLMGQGVAVRDDVPLKITEITGVEVEARTDLERATDGPGELLDPPGDYQLPAKVVDGSATATVQIADLPLALQEEAARAVRESIANRDLRPLDGVPAKVRDVSNVQVVVKAKAAPGAGDGSVLPGVSLSRGFDAVVRLENPPPAFVQAVREADRRGRAVTARVEVKTGSRPIAMLLLRKS